MASRFCGRLFPVTCCCLALLAIGVFMSCQNVQTQRSAAQQKPTAEDYHSLSGILVVPENPRPGQPFWVVGMGQRALSGINTRVLHENVTILPVKSRQGSGLPFWWADYYDSLPTGVYSAVLFAGDSLILKRGLEIDQNHEAPTVQIWKTRTSWTPLYEQLFSVWVNALFDHSSEDSSWTSLHTLTQNAQQNLLFNSLGFSEDGGSKPPHVVMEPDCADNPFFLRAYFAWKMGLPFGFHLSDRGYQGKAPQTRQWITNESHSTRTNPVARFNVFLRLVMDGVHSGTARTALSNEKADYYPVALNREALRPGTVFADPYGHTFIIIAWKPQSEKLPGRLLAVDAQPDGTVAVKRFWEGNFLFNTYEVVGEPGFKAFRPMVLKNGQLQSLTNNQLTDSSGFVPFSLVQQKMERDSFYDRMDQLINPQPLQANDLLTYLIEALHEQLRVRVKSVANGEAYRKAHPGSIIPMPGNARAIFQTGGLWEDFSTPNRDLRLLIAMDAIETFPQKAAAHPERYRLPANLTQKEIIQQLENLMLKETSSRNIAYCNSNGDTITLNLHEILRRKASFEVAYNPNDCIELRWGEADDSLKKTTCRHRTPASQYAIMQNIRKWFEQRLHPPT